MGPLLSASVVCALRILAGICADHPAIWIRRHDRPVTTPVTDDSGTGNDETDILLYGGAGAAPDLFRSDHSCICSKCHGHWLRRISRRHECRAFHGGVGGCWRRARHYHGHGCLQCGRFDNGSLGQGRLIGQCLIAGGDPQHGGGVCPWGRHSAGRMSVFSAETTNDDQRIGRPKWTHRRGRTWRS